MSPIFMAAAEAVRSAGPVLPPIIVGVMPVLLPLVGNRGGDRVPWGRLAPALALVACGIAVADFAAMASAGSQGGRGMAVGLSWACAALLIWVVYGSVNGAVMRTREPPDALRWTGRQGIGAAIGSLTLLPFATHDFNDVTSHDVLDFALWSSVMGVAASWLATLCWTVASRRLPIALTAQFIIAETLFGLLFGLAFEARWPSRAEAGGCVLQIAGVAMAIAAYGQCSRSLRT